MEIASKEIRGLNLKIVIAWVGGVITFVILGTLWYAGINNAVIENRKTTERIEQSSLLRDEQTKAALKEINVKLDAQQLQIEQLKWQWENFKDFYDLDQKPKTTKK